MVFSKSKNSTKLLIGIAIGILFFVIIDALLMVSWFDASGVVLDKGWAVETAEGTESADIPYINIDNEPRTVVFTRDFIIEDSVELGLVVPFPAGTAFKAYLNGEPVGGVGKIGDSTANVWYSSFVYPLENAAQGKNTLRIEVYGLYDVGFRVPPYIEDYKTAIAKVYDAGKIRNNLILILAGVSMAFGILLFISFFKNNRKDRAVLYAAIIGLLAYFAVVDCIFDVGTATVQQLLLLKKTRFAIMFLSLAMVALMFNRARNKPVKWIPPVVLAVSVLSYLPIAVSGSFYDWYTWMGLSFAFLGVNIIIMFCLTLTAKKYSIVNIAMCVLIFAVVLQGLLSNLFGINVPSPLQFAFVSISALIGITYTSQLNNVFDMNRYLEDVSKKDILTDAYNRRMMDLVEGGPGDCVVLMDIDDFKSVNDNYGHEEGDCVLKELVNQISLITRKADVLIRMGGDEFCLLLKDCPMESAAEKMGALSASFAGHYSKYGIGISYGKVKFEQSLDQTLTRADALMYEMKSKHKNEKK